MASPHPVIHAVDSTQALVDGGGLDPPPSPYTQHTPTFPLHAVGGERGMRCREESMLRVGWM
jgi:hypothetical protein